MKPSLQTPKPLPKSRSRENATPSVASLPSHSKTSDLSSSAIPRHPQIRPKSLDTDFSAASEHILSDLPDPLKISGESSSIISVPSKSSDLSGLSDITVDQKVVSKLEYLAGSEHALSDLPHLAVSSAGSSITSDFSAQKPLALGSKSLPENLNKGTYEEVISASFLIKKALSEINGSRDITDDTKLIMDAMFEAAVQQLEGRENSVRTVRLADPVLMAKLRIIMVLLVILFLFVHLLLKVWFVDGQDWPGLTPT